MFSAARRLLPQSLCGAHSSAIFTPPPIFTRTMKGVAFHNVTKNEAFKNISPSRWYPFLITGGAAACAGTYWYSHLEVIPATGRTRMMDVAVEEELELGKAAFMEVVSSSNVLPLESRESQLVLDVVARLVVANWPTSPIEWEVVVVSGAAVNAFALPGGKIVVSAGLLKAFQDNVEPVAVVLAHEIGHVVARHGAENYSKQRVKLLANLFLSTLGLAGTGADLIWQLALSLPYSRAMETEADHLGVLILAKSQYPVSAAPRTWDLMESVAPNSTSEYMSTHPAHQHRKEDIAHFIATYGLEGAQRASGSVKVSKAQLASFKASVVTRVKETLKAAKERGKKEASTPPA